MVNFVEFGQDIRMLLMQYPNVEFTFTKYGWLPLQVEFEVTGNYLY